MLGKRLLREKIPPTRRDRKRGIFPHGYDDAPRRGKMSLSNSLLPSLGDVATGAVNL